VTLAWSDFDPPGRELVLLIERAKYERWLASQVSDLLSRTFNDVVDAILSPTFRTLSVNEQQRKYQLFRELDALIRKGYAGVVQRVKLQMGAYARVEAQIAAEQITSVLSESEALSASLAMVSSTSLQSIAELPIQGLNISEWFDAQAQGMSRETRRAIQNGLLQGKSLPEIASAIVPPRNSVNPAVYRRARNEATMITRTTVNAVQNHAAVESYIAAGDDVSDSYRFVAVRDARTTPICRSLDGKVFSNSDPTAPQPPMHVGCRSGVVPIVNGAFLTKTAQRNQPMTFGSYGEWLRTQGNGIQDSILGATRADMWRRGRMTLADAVDADGRTLSLEELAKRLGLSSTPARDRIPI
jgi:SPP1 gp7 family putative phage head morphogenesis protein